MQLHFVLCKKVTSCWYLEDKVTLSCIYETSAHGVLASTNYTGGEREFVAEDEISQHARTSQPVTDNYALATDKQTT